MDAPFFLLSVCKLFCLSCCSKLWCTASSNRATELSLDKLVMFHELASHGSFQQSLRPACATGDPYYLSSLVRRTFAYIDS